MKFWIPCQDHVQAGICNMFSQAQTQDYRRIFIGEYPQSEWPSVTYQIEYTHAGYSEARNDAQYKERH